MLCTYFSGYSRLIDCMREMKGEVPLEFWFVHPFFLWSPCVQVLETLKTSGCPRPAIFPLSNPTSNGEVLLFAICMSLCKLNLRHSLLSYQWLKVSKVFSLWLNLAKLCSWVHCKRSFSIWWAECYFCKWQSLQRCWSRYVLFYSSKFSRGFWYIYTAKK